jgi:peptidoglycan/LPS O-acetylase OafA/YrhL
MMTSSTSRPSISTPEHRNIPSLDGLRAFSILAVILAHSSWYFPVWLKENSFFRFGIGNSRTGVTVFFVISGFLITNLLLREWDKTESISLKHFYFRRSMRIFPAFYIYLAALGVLWAMHVAPQDAKSFLASATYTWCYYPKAQGYFLQHSWSLSIEEQFYIFWPALLLVLHAKDRLIRASMVLILLCPLVRLSFYFIFPSLRGLEYYLLYGWLDTMMVGCLLALLNRRPSFQQWKHRFLSAWTACLMAAIAFYINPFLVDWMPKPYTGIYALVFFPFTTAVCIAGVMLYVAEHPESVAGRFLNMGWIRQIGVLSYSLYLWQQVFVSHRFNLLPYGYLYLILAAALSYWAVERPFLRLRAYLEKRHKARPPVLAA